MESTVSIDQAVETFGAATEENQIDPYRDQQIISLPAEGEVWIVGDMHDHRRNFEKLQKSVDLGNNPQRHLILQELIHGEHFDADGAEELGGAGDCCRDQRTSAAFQSS